MKDIRSGLARKRGIENFSFMYIEKIVELTGNFLNMKTETKVE
jgi:hypothetical protein